jgi:ankyrin repeat protein
MNRIKKIKLFFNPRALIDVIKNDINITANEVKDWLESGADPNIQDDNKDTALVVALKKGAAFEVIQALLLDKGSDQGIQNGIYDIALIQAIIAGATLEVIQSLLNKGADPNIEHDENTALIWAIRKHCSLDVIQALLDKGACPNTQGGNNDTALIWAFYKEATVEVIQALLDKGAAPNIKGYKNETALTWALRKGATLEMITLLFDAKADINVIQDPAIFNQADALFKKVEAQRLQEFLCMKNMVLTEYNPNLSSIVVNSEVPVVIKEFLSIRGCF